MTYIEQNKVKIANGLKNYFDNMVNDTFAYAIPFTEYKKYYIHLTNSIKSGLLPNYMYYVVSLYYAEVLLSDEEDEKEYTQYKEYLSTLISKNVASELDNKGIILKEKFSELIKLIETRTITVEEFPNACKLYKLALMSTENLDFAHILKVLLNANVSFKDNYIESYRYYNYQLQLLSCVPEFEKETQK